MGPDGALATPVWNCRTGVRRAGKELEFGNFPARRLLMGPDGALATPVWNCRTGVRRAGKELEFGAPAVWSAGNYVGRCSRVRLRGALSVTSTLSSMRTPP